MHAAWPQAVSEQLDALTGDVVAELGCDRTLLDGYLSALLSVAVAAGQLSAAQRDSIRRIGGEAAQVGMSLPTLVDLYVTASRQLWPRLPELVEAARGRPVRPGELMGLGDAMWAAADHALAEVADGYVQAQRLVVRREEASRQQFLDDLLRGSSSVGSLVERAEPYGLNLAAVHVVAVVQAGERLDAGDRTTGRVEEAVRVRGGREVLVTVKDGRLVCVLSTAPPERVEDGQDGSPDQTGGQAGGQVGGQDTSGQQLARLAADAVAELASGAALRVGVSRPHAGPRGVFVGYSEALEALDVADRLRMPDQVVHARQLLVYRVLLRDETAMSALVEAVLGPLVVARDGPERLLETLEAYFTSGGNTAAAARQLHLSVRAMTYRLQRVAELTGYTAGDPAHQLPLHVAVMGARLLDWPGRPLVDE